MEARQAHCLLLVFLLSTIAAPLRLCARGCSSAYESSSVSMQPGCPETVVGKGKRDQHSVAPFFEGQQYRCNRCAIGRVAIYWRRGQRLSNFSDSHIEDMWEFWETTGVCCWWRACVAHCHFSRGEFIAGCHLGGCILAVPVVGLGVLAARYVLYMMPSRTEMPHKDKAFLFPSCLYDMQFVCSASDMVWKFDLACKSYLDV